MTKGAALAGPMDETGPKLPGRVARTAAAPSGVGSVWGPFAGMPSVCSGALASVCSLTSSLTCSQRNNLRIPPGERVAE